MQRIPVQLATQPYDIVIGSGSLSQLGQHVLSSTGKQDCKVLVVSNPDVASPYGDLCLNSLRASGYDCLLYTSPSPRDS